MKPAEEIIITFVISGYLGLCVGTAIEVGNEMKLGFVGRTFCFVFAPVILWVHRKDDWMHRSPSDKAAEN